MTGKFDVEVVIIYTDLGLVERKLEWEMCFAYYRVFKRQLAAPWECRECFQQRLRKGKKQHIKIS